MDIREFCSPLIHNSRALKNVDKAPVCTRVVLFTVEWCDPQLLPPRSQKIGMHNGRLSLMLQQLPLDPLSLDRNKDDQGNSHRHPHRQEQNVDGYRVSIKGNMEQIIQPRLGEIEQPRQADDGSVNRAEGAEAKHFGAVIGHGGVVEWAIEHKEANVGVSSPCLGDDAKETNGGGTCHEDRENSDGACMVKDATDKGNRNDTAQWKGEVEEVVEYDSLILRAQDRLVLNADGGDKVVDSCHLDDY